MPEPGGPARAGKSARAGKLSLAAAENFSLEATIGGPRGVAESVIPYAAFSVVYGITKDLKLSIIWAVVPLVLLAVVRLVKREPLTQVIGGAIGVTIGAALALKYNKPEFVFLPSLIRNSGFAVAYLFSMLIRWPIIGVMVGQITGELFAWRANPPRLRAYQLATGLWVGMFLLRLLVQIPLYLANQVTLLGLLNVLVLGIPFFAATIWLSWLVLRSVPLALPPEDDTHSAGDDAGASSKDSTVDDAGEPADEAQAR